MAALSVTAGWAASPQHATRSTRAAKVHPYASGAPLIRTPPRRRPRTLPHIEAPRLATTRAATPTTTTPARIAPPRDIPPPTAAPPPNPTPSTAGILHRPSATLHPPRPQAQPLKPPRSIAIAPRPRPPPLLGSAFFSTKKKRPNGRLARPSKPDQRVRRPGAHPRQPRSGRPHFPASGLEPLPASSTLLVNGSLACQPPLLPLLDSPFPHRLRPRPCRTLPRAHPGQFRRAHRRVPEAAHTHQRQRRRRRRRRSQSPPHRCHHRHRQRHHEPAGSWLGPLLAPATPARRQNRRRGGVPAGLLPHITVYKTYAPPPPPSRAASPAAPCSPPRPSSPPRPLSLRHAFPFTRMRIPHNAGLGYNRGQPHFTSKIERRPHGVRHATHIEIQIGPAGCRTPYAPSAAMHQPKNPERHTHE